MRLAKFLSTVFLIVQIPVVAQSVNTTENRESRSTIPKLWDEEALAAMNLPPARAEGEIVYVSSDYFLRDAVRRHVQDIPRLPSRSRTSRVLKLAKATRT